MQAQGRVWAHLPAGTGTPAVFIGPQPLERNHQLGMRPRCTTESIQQNSRFTFWMIIHVGLEESFNGAFKSDEIFSRNAITQHNVLCDMNVSTRFLVSIREIIAWIVRTVMNVVEQ